MSSLGLDTPMSPVSPGSPLPSAVEKTRKYSPLIDLIESEKAYVDLLTGIIRKVAAAWSRSNLPPLELDTMFRSVEAVYKANRMLSANLKEIGEHPSSPKALGDLLMRWIDDLEQPYMAYADKYCFGFDDWEPVKANAKLPVILQAFSTSNPPPSALPQPTRLVDPSLWTLDALFLLPKGRLQYYRKLYSRLLKSTTPGRSDHRLLTGALGKLDFLLATLDDRTNTCIGTPKLPQVPRIDARTSFTNELTQNSTPTSRQPGVESASVATSLQGGFTSGNGRLSQEATSTPASQEPSQTMPSSVLDLEKRLATDNTLDIFTMQPKQIRLQIASSTLSYPRELRLSAKVLVRFTSRATGEEVVHPHGHVYILSDLFLLCEEMAREERAARGEDGRDMYLCYPPLSGKVLDVTEVPGQDNALQVSIMDKEILTLEADSQLKRDRILDELEECVSFAKTVLRAAQEPVPLMPPTRLRTKERPERAVNPRLITQFPPGSVPAERADDAASSTSSPMQNSPLSGTSHSRLHHEQHNVVLARSETNQDLGRNADSNLSSSPTSPGNGQRPPTLHNSGSAYPPRTSSAGYPTNSPPSSFIPGQIIPPARSASIQSQSPPFGVSVSDLPGGPRGVYPPSNTQNPIPWNSTLRHQASMLSHRQQPTQYQPPHHSLPHSQQHQISIPPPPAAPHPPNKPFHTRPPSPPVTSHPPEQPLPRLQKSASSRSLRSQYQYNQAPPPPPMPLFPDGLSVPRRPNSQRKDSMGSQNIPVSRPLLPSMQMRSRTNSVAEPSILDPSPPTSPVEERRPPGPVRSVITAQMKCKVFHQQHHAQWRSLGSANLTVYRQEPTNIKQLVVEAGSKEKSILISTIVLTDGVERVGKTGVAIELSDAVGARTGVIYMIQLRNEDSASELFKALLEGSDRAA